MKKNVWLLGVAVAALTSCTQSEVVDVPESRVIGFDTHVDKQTRATNDIGDLSTDFKELYVFGAIGTGSTLENATTFNPQNARYINHVKLTGGKGNWTYEPHASWVKDRTFRFAAYANGLGNGTNSQARLNEVTDVTNLNSDTYIEFVPEEEVKENGLVTGHVWGLNINNYTVSDKDLIVAIPEEKVVTDLTTAPASVGLTFKHVLAKVIFQFRYTANTQNTNLHLDITPFSVTAYRTGDCKLRYTGITDNSKIGAVWTVDGSKVGYEFFPQIDKDENGVKENQTWNSGNIQSECYVIPQPNTELTIPLIRIDSYDGNVVTATTEFENVSLKFSQHETWLPGYVYRYIADITPGQHYIHFTTSVTSWIDEDNRNQTIQNGTTSTPTPES